jgi:CCR4-NOT transcription complex subunit 9
METGSELSKTVAIFIVQKILLDDMGLQYICQTYERFYAVGTVLSNMVTQLVDQQTVRLLKHVVRCFLRYVFPCKQIQYYLFTDVLQLVGQCSR